MDNTFTKTVSGKLCYFDGEGLPDDTPLTVDNTEFSWIKQYPVSITEPWVKKTLGGVSCVLWPSDLICDSDGGLGIQRNFGTEKTIFIQGRVYRPLTNAQTVFGRKNPASNNLWLWVWDYINAYITWSIGHNQYNNSIAPRYTVNNVWTLLQTYNAHNDALCVSEQYIKDIATDKITARVSTNRAPIADSFGSSASDIWAFCCDTRGSTIYSTKMLIAKNKYLTVAGLTAGMIICLLDASDNVIFSGKATGATFIFDLMGIEAPLNHKLQVIGTDGIELLKTDALTIYHGDTWTYSGDISGPVKSRKRIIIDGGVIG